MTFENISEEILKNEQQFNDAMFEVIVKMKPIFEELKLQLIKNVCLPTSPYDENSITAHTIKNRIFIGHDYNFTITLDGNYYKIDHEDDNLEYDGHYADTFIEMKGADVYFNFRNEEIERLKDLIFTAKFLCNNLKK